MSDFKVVDCKLCGGIPNFDENDGYDDILDLDVYCEACGFSMDTVENWNGLENKLLAKANAEIERLESIIGNALLIMSGRLEHTEEELWEKLSEVSE